MGSWTLRRQPPAFLIACCLAALCTCSAWFAAALFGRQSTSVSVSLHFAQAAAAEAAAAEAAARTGTPQASPFLPAASRRFGAPLPAVHLDAGTPAFEPAAYAALYPDLGNLTDDGLAVHFLLAGRGQHRVPRRLRLLFAYDAAGGMDLSVVYGGLCNQIYSHVGMLALAIQLGAEVVRRVRANYLHSYFPTVSRGTPVTHRTLPI